MPASGLHISSLEDLPPEQLREALNCLTDRETDELLHEWAFFARPEQLPPETDWRTWLFLAGRGAGKTRSGAEWIRHKVRTGSMQLGLIAPTSADARDVMVEGPSGILAVSWAHDKDPKRRYTGIPHYEPSKRRLTWSNGAIATCYSAEEPDRLRGPSHSAIWCDELAAWQSPQAAWDMAMFGLRVGQHPQVMISTTPRPITLLKDLLKAKTTVVSRAETYANRRNLAGAFLSQIITKYEGTRLGRQELAGELLEEIEGALWTLAMIDAQRVRADVVNRAMMQRVVIAVDPSGCAGSDDTRSDEVGIVVVGRGQDGNGYVLQDASGHYSPEQWARTVCGLFDVWAADRIIAESNFGGAMVDHTIRSVRKTAPVKLVNASRGKFQRAEPIAALYEQGKVKHAGAFPAMEDQLCSFAAHGYQGERSPDRADALIWGLSELMLQHEAPRAVMMSY